MATATRSATERRRHGLNDGRGERKGDMDDLVMRCELLTLTLHQERANNELVHGIIIVTNLLVSSVVLTLVEMSTNCYTQLTLAQISTN